MIAPRTFSFATCRSCADATDQFRGWLAQIAADSERHFLSDILSDPDLDDLDVNALDVCVAGVRRCWADAIEQDIDTPASWPSWPRTTSAPEMKLDASLEAPARRAGCA